MFKISGRGNIEASEMGFKCLFIHRNWTALAPEDSLIRYYREAGEGECAWNGNGFGPHDPGHDRETTADDPDGFDLGGHLKSGQSGSLQSRPVEHRNCKDGLLRDFARQRIA
jgi:hypothetical protein